MEQEKFTWASDISLEATPFIAIGPGYLVMAPDKDPCAIGAPKDIVCGKLPGHLLSAATLLEVKDSRQSKWVLLERDSLAPSYAGKWQFPSGRLSPDELPLNCAIRELGEEVRLLQAGCHFPLNDVEYRVGGTSFDWLTQSTIHSGVRARHVFFDNTVEFFYPATLLVADVELVEAVDNEPYGRKVKLLTSAEIDQLDVQNKLCPASALQWHELKMLLKSRSAQG